MTREQKNNVRYLLARRQNVSPGVMMLMDVHHMHIHDTKPNRKRFPLLIDSAWNRFLLHHNTHMENPSYVMGERWSLLECDRRERFLERHPAFADYINGRWHE